MLKKKVLIFEWIFVAFFACQAIWPEEFGLQSALILFAIVLFTKYFLEGLRFNIILFFMTQFIFMLINHEIIRLALLIIPVFAIFYFPVFDFPPTTGMFFSAFRVLKLRNHIEVSVYYPTTALTDAVMYTPSNKAWLRFHRYLISKGSKLPSWLFQLGLGFLNHIELPVQFESHVISKDHLTHGKKFPVILLSHGIACNRNLYTTFAREWASHGYMVFSVDHEEYIDLPTRFTKKELNTYRFHQLKKRKEAIGQVLDYISNPENVQDLFDDGFVELDLGRVSVVGQSLGGAAALYTAMNDKRINGVCILLDPSVECINDEMKGKSATVPVLLIRTVEDIIVGGHGGKELMIEVVDSNKPHLKQSMCCIIEDSTHVSQTDLVLHMPRECLMLNMMGSMALIEDTLAHYSKLTRMYLDTMLFHKEPNESMPGVEMVLKKFNASIKKDGKKNRLVVDKLH